MMRLAAHMNIRRLCSVETELKSVYSMRNKDDRIDILTKHALVWIYILTCIYKYDIMGLSKESIS